MNTKYLRICSDLHLEQFSARSVEKNELACLPFDDRDAESILVMAGDISARPHQLVEFVKKVETRFKRVVYVPGNHEYYNHEMTALEPLLKEELSKHTSRTSYAIGEVLCEQIDGIRFIFGTMWANGGKSREELAKVGRGLWDFGCIMLNGTLFSVHDMIAINRKMCNDIESFLLNDNSGMKNVVVSHHLPSYGLCHPRFGNSINGGFATDFDELLASEHAPDIWIHGHTHDTFDKKYLNARIVCNPRGYAKEFEFEGGEKFNDYGVQPKFIEI